LLRLNARAGPGYPLARRYGTTAAAPRMEYAMSRRAFTLLELLVVISIIAALAALLVPIISIARKAAKDAKCATLMGQIGAALAGYKDANGSFPEQLWQTLGSDPFASAFGMSNAGSTPVAVTSLTEANWRSVNFTLKSQLQTVDPDTFRNTPSNPLAATPDLGDPGNYIVDPYGTRNLFAVIRYRPARYYPFNGAVSSSNPTIDTANPPNPNSYQLWSCGWDGKDEFGEKLWTINGMILKGDDVMNWSNK
jgi:prepilin-type N-terminal cleavage/methylation domain-containing protein